MHNRKLGRTSDHRVALLRTMACQLILKGKMETTQMKAKELQAVVEKLITVAKKNDLAAIRKAQSFLRPIKAEDGKSVLNILFKEVAPRYVDRKGGYTRLTLTKVRRGDAAQMALIELI